MHLGRVHLGRVHLGRVRLGKGASREGGMHLGDASSNVNPFTAGIIHIDGGVAKQLENQEILNRAKN